MLQVVPLISSMVDGDWSDELRPDLNGIQLETNYLEQTFTELSKMIPQLTPHFPANSIHQPWKSSSSQQVIVKNGSLQAATQLLVVGMQMNREK